MGDKKIFGGFIRVADSSGSGGCCEPGASCCGPATQPEANAKTSVKVFDPPMCCATGVCGPNVNPALARFAADLKWLEGQGIAVERFNLAQQPQAFAENATVCKELEGKGETVLPLILAGGKVVSRGAYPSREELTRLIGIGTGAEGLFNAKVAELVAIGAAIACNCDSCLRYHVKVARQMGISAADIKSAVEMAARVKEAPHNIVMKLAEKLTQDGKDEGDPAESA